MSMQITTVEVSQSL